MESSESSRLVWNFGFDEFCQEDQGFLPTEIAGLGRNRGGNSFLGHVQFGSAEYFAQSDGGDHFAWQVCIVEFVCVTKAFVWLQFEIFPTEGVAFAGGKIGE